MAQRETLYSIALIVSLALLPLIAIDMPRFYALGPGMIGIIFLALYTPTFKEKPLFNRYIWLIPGALLLFASLSILWSVAPDTSLDRVKKLLVVLLPGGLFLTLIKNIRIEKTQPFLWIVPASVILAALLAAFEFITNGIFYKLLRGLDFDISVPGASFNRGAVATVLCAFPAYFMARQYLSNTRTLLVFALPFALMVIFTQSQSAQLALFAGLLVFFFFPYRRKKAWIALIGLITATIFTAPFIAIWMFEQLALLLDTLPFFGVHNGYAGARLEIWNFISHHIAQKPLLGYGIEATKIIDDFTTEKIYFTGQSVLHPHNFALQFWIEFGALGAATISAICGNILWMMQKHLSPEQCKITLPPFIAAMSVAATGYGFWQSWWLGLLFMVSGLCLIAVKLKAPEIRA